MIFKVKNMNIFTLNACYQISFPNQHWALIVTQIIQCNWWKHLLFVSLISFSLVLVRLNIFFSHCVCLLWVNISWFVKIQLIRLNFPQLRHLFLNRVWLIMIGSSPSLYVIILAEISPQFWYALGFTILFEVEEKESR